MKKLLITLICSMFTISAFADQQAYDDCIAKQSGLPPWKKNIDSCNELKAKTPEEIEQEKAERTAQPRPKRHKKTSSEVCSARTMNCRDSNPIPPWKREASK